MKPDSNYILWLPSWYPNKENAFDGDFIQRHAQAAALENNIHVLFIKAIDQKELQSEEIQQQDNLTEQIIYIKKEHGLLKKLLRQREWFRQYKKAIQHYIKVNGLPKLVHVHVPWRAGLLALWIKRNYQIPYVVTEHWGIYNNILENRFSAQPRWIQALIKTIFRQAQCLISVSQFLANQIGQYGILKKYSILPNVVDTVAFHFKANLPTGFTFLHVSNMVPLKNVSGILKAFAVFQQLNPAVKLVLIGNRDANYEFEAEKLHIPKNRIFFLGEIPYKEVAKEMQQAHCLIVNSLIENSPCVIGEALCCGTPVIGTDVGGIPELIDSSNGILIPPIDSNALLAAMQQVYENFKKFDRVEIARIAAKKFGMHPIAHQFTALYHSVVP